MNNESLYDLLIIGGGINGTAIALDAANRGLTTILCEQNDLGSATSSASSKLIHGGLRYLEQGNFRLVKEALQEREILLQRAPHLINPLEFILPYQPHLRPRWLIRLGLWLYDHLAKHLLIPKSRSINLKKNSVGKPLKEIFHHGFSYYDCISDDSRLVISNALTAQEYGATILPRHKVIEIKNQNDHWQVKVIDTTSQVEKTILAKAIVNVTGPWVNDILQMANISGHKIKLSQGSHIVIPKLYNGEHAYLLQNSDKRIVFVIPYQEKFTLIGTTDIDYQSNINDIEATEHEKQYLCDNVNYYFKKNITPADILWHYSGVRVLLANGNDNLAQLSRDYFIDISHENAPILSVYGGKLTTHRILAETILEKLQPYFPKLLPSKTKTIPLLGGDIQQGNFELFLKNIFQQYPWLPKDIALRYAHQYGTRIHILLDDCHNLNDLGHHFGGQIYQREIDFLVVTEWARTSDDILWRRTKLGLITDDNTKEKIRYYLSGLDEKA